MGLAAKVHVKISSEAAGYVAMTPVIVREMELRELLEHIAAQTGGEPARVLAVWRRGSAVSGASRLRWQPPTLSDADMLSLLEQLPGPDPARPCDPSRCLRLVLVGAGRRQEIDRTAAAQRRFLKTRSGWDELAAALPAWPYEYAGYLYRERADHYRIRLGAAQRELVRRACALFRFSVTVADPETLELIVPR